MPISTLSGIAVGASVSIGLLGSISALAAWAQTAQHPSFQNVLGGQFVRDGWGIGDHYFHETDADGWSVIGPGENNKTFHVSPDTGKNVSLQDVIDEQPGVSNNNQAAAYIRDQSPGSIVYGSQVRPLDTSAAALTRSVLPSGGVDVWFLLERGYDYGQTDWVQNGVGGISPLHPYVVGAWGTGAKPTIGHFTLIPTNEDNIVVRDVDVAPAAGTYVKYDLYGMSNILFENCAFSRGELNVQGSTRFTLYRCGLLFATRTEPYLGKADWNSESTLDLSLRNNRTSGIFFHTSVGGLFLQNWAFHNGWEDGYSQNNWEYNAGEFGQPPNVYSHNFYIQFSNTDTTFMFNYSAEPASSHVQFRSGGQYLYNVFVEGNIAGPIPSGRGSDNNPSPPLTGDEVGTGNYTLMLDNLHTSAQYLLSGNGTLSGAGNWGWNGSGNGLDITSLNNLAVHAIDPNNPAEAAAKNAITTNSQFPFSWFGKEYLSDNVVYNWVQQPDEGVDGLDPSVMNNRTVQKYCEDVLALGGFTPRDFTNHLLASAEPWQVAEDFNEWMRAGFGLPRAITDRTTPQTVNFIPWLSAEGYRWDNPKNWSTGYYPINGDTVNLGAGNEVRSPWHTIDLASLVLGSGTTLRITGGRIEATGITAPDETVYVTNVGQFHLGGHSAPQGVLVSVTNGRFFNKGIVTQGVSASCAGTGELILATTGGAFTLAAGESLTLTGGDVLCGFDGTDGGAASITFGGTVNMNAASGALPQIREFRSGMWGETATSVASTITCGGTLNVDITGVAAGTYDLIIADTVTGTFDTVDITGGSGSVSYTANAVRITVT